MKKYIFKIILILWVGLFFVYLAHYWISVKKDKIESYDFNNPKVRAEVAAEYEKEYGAQFREAITPYFKKDYKEASARLERLMVIGLDEFKIREINKDIDFSRAQEMVKYGLAWVYKDSGEYEKLVSIRKNILGDYELAVESGAKELSQFSLDAKYRDLAVAQYYAGDYNDAADNLKRVKGNVLYLSYDDALLDTKIYFKSGNLLNSIKSLLDLLLFEFRIFNENNFSVYGCIVLALLCITLLLLLSRVLSQIYSKLLRTYLYLKRCFQKMYILLINPNAILFVGVVFLVLRLFVPVEVKVKINRGYSITKIDTQRTLMQSVGIVLATSCLFYLARQRRNKFKKEL